MSERLGSVGVFGATGFIGGRVAMRLEAAGWTVVRFSRRPPEGVDGWRVAGERPDLSGLTAVINLAGESIAQRWTSRTWERIVTSRVGVTGAIVEAIRRLDVEARPNALLNASAIGIYEPHPEQELPEEAAVGASQIATLCRDWEAEAMQAEKLGVRVVPLRTGIVLGDGGDAWGRLQKLFRFGLGGRLGSGRQWMPWVHIEDEVGAIEFALGSDEVRGPLNISAPEPVTNREFTEQLARRLGRPAVLHAPGFALKTILGGFGESLLASYRVVPRRLRDHGYAFRHPNLAGALDDLCS